MRTDSIRTTTVVLILALFSAAAIVLLNTGAVPSSAAAAECGSGGGGGGQTPTPSGSATPTPTSTGGGLPTGLPTLPGGGGSSSAPPTSTPSATPTSGGGGSVDCDSKITIGYDPPGPQEGAKAGFNGKVTSDDNICIKARNVIVKRDTARKDKKVGTSVTNKKGLWKLPVQKAAGKYYAKTPARRIVEDDGTEVNCGAAKSKTIRV
ncbi:MAG: hypothetical protein QOG54_1586 [Actinomycetota bacterium]|nr:hypothetical protein [Actinomycetota bacterium]